MQSRHVFVLDPDTNVSTSLFAFGPTGSPPPPVPECHATGVLERDSKGDWKWLAWHIARPVDAKTQAKAIAAGRTPPPIPRAVSKQAEAVVNVFEASIGRWSSNNGIAYVAANVDATNLKRPKDKPVPYRLLAIYENAGGWKLVSAHFSYLAK